MTTKSTKSTTKSPRAPKIVVEKLDALGFPIPAAAQEPVIVPVEETNPVVTGVAPVVVVVKAVRVVPEAPLCLCGCLVQTSSHLRTFRQGHDARLVGMFRKAPEGLSEAQVAAATQIINRKLQSAAAKLPSTSSKPILEAAPAEQNETTSDEAAASNVG